MMGQLSKDQKKEIMNVYKVIISKIGLKQVHMIHS